jgi:hypothetical protein
MSFELVNTNDIVLQDNCIVLHQNVDVNIKNN